MKTFVAALAAGLIGGGAALGVVALDLIPRTPTSETAKSAELLTLDGEDSTTTSRNYEDEITDLKHEIDALKLRVSKADEKTDNETEIAALKAEVEALKKVRTSAPAIDQAGENGESTPAVTPEFDDAVREVLNRVQEENQENRRLERQAERLQQLETQKAQIAEFIPTLVQNQAGNLGIDESVVPDVSAALVTHAQYRAELASEMQGLRIDGQEVDTQAYQQKFEELNQTTIAALTTYVDQETAERLVNTITRAARNNRDNGRTSNRQNRRGQ